MSSFKQFSLLGLKSAWVEKYRFWLCLACMLALLFLWYQALILWAWFQSDLGKNGNANIAWGTMCRADQCRPAALLYGSIPLNAQPVLDELKKRPDIKTLCLDSNGGSSVGAHEIASFVVDQEFDTCIPQIGTKQNQIDLRCASACTYIFVEGQHRYLTPTASFQIHRATVSSGQKIYEMNEEVPAVDHYVETAKAYAAQLVLGSGYWYFPPSLARDKLLSEARNTPSYRLRSVTPAQLLDWGVLTEPATLKVTFSKAPG